MPKFVVIPVGWGHFSYLKLEEIAVITDGGTMSKCYREKDHFVLGAFSDLFPVKRKAWIFSHFHFDHYSLMAAFQKATTSPNRFSHAFLDKGDVVVVPYQSTPECRKAIAGVVNFLVYELISKLPWMTADEATTIIAPWISGGSSVRRIPVKTGDRIIIQSRNASFEYLFLSPNPSLLERLDPLLCRQVSQKIIDALNKAKEKEPERFAELEETLSEIQRRALAALEIAHDSRSSESLTYPLSVDERAYPLSVDERAYPLSVDERDFEEDMLEVDSVETKKVDSVETKKVEISMEKREVVEALKSAQMELKKVLGTKLSKSLNSTSISYALTGKDDRTIIYLGDLQDETLLENAICTFLCRRGFSSRTVLVAPHHGNAWSRCLKCLDPFLTIFTRCDKHLRYNNLRSEYDQFAYHAYITHDSPLELYMENGSYP